MLDDLLVIMFSAGLLLVAFGMQPSISVGAADEQGCQHVTVTRMYGLAPLFDAVVCEGDNFNLSGETIEEIMNGE